MVSAYGNPVSVFLPDALSFSLALLEGVLVLELGAHGDGWVFGFWRGVMVVLDVLWCGGRAVKMIAGVEGD